MLKSILKETGVQEINKKQQKSINGGKLSLRCPYVCHGTTARQPSGASQYCLLNFPINIYNASQCTGGGDDGPGDWA